MKKEKLEMAAPWIEYFSQIQALFENDTEIKIIINYDDNLVKLYVDNSDKAAAIEKLIPREKVFGNVTARVIVIPANQEEKSRAELIETAFKGNPVFKLAKTITGAFNNPISYIVFKKEVVQYPIDNLHDLYGNRNTLYQEIAKEVIGEEEGICFCTDNSSFSF